MKLIDVFVFSFENSLISFEIFKDTLVETEERFTKIVAEKIQFTF